MAVWCVFFIPVFHLPSLAFSCLQPASILWLMCVPVSSKLPPAVYHRWWIMSQVSEHEEWVQYYKTKKYIQSGNVIINLNFLVIRMKFNPERQCLLKARKNKNNVTTSTSSWMCYWPKVYAHVYKHLGYNMKKLTRNRSIANRHIGVDISMETHIAKPSMPCSNIWSMKGVLFLNKIPDSKVHGANTNRQYEAWKYLMTMSIEM